MTQTDYAAATAVDFTEIPVIDLSRPDREALALELVETAMTVGFFYISGHGVDPVLRQRAFAASERFFALPEVEKARVEVDRNQRGWMAQGKSTLEGSKTHDAKEVFFWGWEIDEGDPDLNLPLVARNQWPETAPWLREELEPYYLAVVEAGRKVLGLLAEGLGADATLFEAAYRKPLARGQLVYYPPIDRADREAERFSAAAHTDFGVLTMLAQDDRGGLQVQNKAGDWIAASPIHNTYVCNIGDLLESWSGGRLVSTNHRVLNSSGKSRYSIPIFCDPASETVIDPGRLIPGTPSGNVVSAGDYIAGKNRKNFTHYESK